MAIPHEFGPEITFPRKCEDFRFLYLGQAIRERSVDPKTICVTIVLIRENLD